MFVDERGRPIYVIYFKEWLIRTNSMTICIIIIIFGDVSLNRSPKSLIMLRTGCFILIWIVVASDSYYWISWWRGAKYVLSRFSHIPQSSPWFQGEIMWWRVVDIIRSWTIWMRANDTRGGRISLLMLSLSIRLSSISSNGRTRNFASSRNGASGVDRDLLKSTEDYHWNFHITLRRFQSNSFHNYLSHM